MKRVIVDYAKLTNEILTLLVEKFPDGYDDTDIIRFKNAKNETVEAIEVRTEDTIYLVKVSLKLADRIENFEDEDDDLVVDLVVTKPPIKDIEDEVEDEDDEDSYGNDKPEFDDEDDEDEKDSLDDEDDE